MVALVLTALAASPGGFRLGPAVPVRSIAIREASSLRRAWVSQTTLAARWSHRAFGVTCEVPLVLQGGPLRASAGQLRAGVHRHWRVADGALSLGVEGAVAVAPWMARSTAWAVHARDTVPGGEVLAVAELGVSPSAPFTARVGLGFLSGPAHPFGHGGFRRPLPLAEVGVARVVPVAGPLALVLEADAVVDRRPLTARALARFDSARISVDLGGQFAPLPSPSAAVLGQARSHF